MKARLRKILSVMLVFCLVAAGAPAGTNQAWADTISVTTEEDLRSVVDAAYAGDAVISIDGDINLTGDLTIGRDVTLTSASGSTLNAGANKITIPAGKAVTFGGGLQVEGSGASVVDVTGTGEFTLAGTASVEQTSEAGSGQAVQCNSTTGRISITGGSIQSPYAGIKTYSALTVSDGQVSGGQYGIRVMDGSATISGGVIQGSDADGIAAYVGSSGTLSISGGTFAGAGYAVQSAGMASITGGTFTGGMGISIGGTIDMDKNGNNITFSDGVYFNQSGIFRPFLTAVPGPVAAAVSVPQEIELQGVYNGVSFSIDAAATDEELGAIISDNEVTLEPTVAGDYTLALKARGITTGGEPTEQYFNLTIPVTVTGAAVTNVCEISSVPVKRYATLSGALAEVEDGQTITLLDDINHNQGIAVNAKNIVFNLNGHTLNVTNQTGTGLDVENGSVTLFGDSGAFNVSGTGYGVKANNAIVHVTNVISSDTGTYAENSGDISVAGDAVGNLIGVVADGLGSSITVTGTATGGAGGSGADALNGAVVSVGNATATGANSCGVRAASNASIVVNGNAQGAKFGATVDSGATVTVEGTVAGENYVRVGAGTLTAGDKTEPTTKTGYHTYTDGTSTIWVKAAAAPLTGPAVWHYRSPLPSTNLIEDMEHIDGKYMALGRNGTLIISTNGVNWQKVQVGADTDYLTGLAYGGGKYVIVGNAETNDYAARIYTSGDGTAWHETAAVAHHRLYDVAYGQGKFVAVGTSGKILVSSDGENWVTQTLTYPANQKTTLQSITYSDEKGKFVAAGTSATTADHRGGIITSADGENWTLTYSDAVNSLWDVTYGNGTFVAVGGKDTGAYYICVSSDGVSWTPSSTGFSAYAQLFSVQFDGTRFIAAGRTNSGGSAFTTTSPNGVSWTDKTGSGLPGFQAVASSGTQLVAMGGYGNIYTSDNLGTNWTYRTRGTTKELKDVAWNGSNLYVAVGVEGTIQTSPDGANWTSQISGTTSDLNKVDYLGGQFIAVGKNGTILTSTNGTDWSAQTSGTTRELKGLAYGGGKYFVVGGDSSFNPVVLVSGDGASWSSESTSGLINSSFVAVAYGDGVFLALMRYGQAYRYSVDPDTGEFICTRVADLATSSKYPTDMIYAGGKFAAVGGYGEIYLSSDRGDSWTTVVNGLNSYSWGITEGGGNLVAAGELGRIIASADGGTTWLAQPSGLKPNHYSSNNYIRLNGIVAGDNCFVAVGENGLVLQSASFTVSADADAHDVHIARSGLGIHNILGSGSNAHAGLIVANMYLPTSWDNGVAISWTSSKPEYVATNGTVTRPSFSAGNQVVYLTANLTKGSAADTKTFVVVVLAQPDPDISIVEAAVAALTFNVIKGSNTAENNIVSNLNLITNWDNGVAISWASSKTDYIAVDGTVTRPAHGAADQAVTLTATVSKGAVSRTKTFNLTVKALVELDVQAVAAAKAALVNGTVTVPAGSDQTAKTAAVQSYVNGLLALVPDAAGVTAIVTYISGNQYSVALSKGSASDSKILAMTINESVDPDIAIVNSAKTAAENATYGNMTQAAAGSENAIKAAVRNTAVTAVNNSNVSVTINTVSYLAPVAGTSANPGGTNGSYTFTVTVSKGAQSQTTTEKTITISATAYTSPSPGGGGGGGSSAPAPVTSIISDVSETAADKALDKALIKENKAVLSLAGGNSNTAQISAAVIARLAEYEMPFTVENTGLRLDFAPGTLPVPRVTGGALIEIGAREITGTERENILAQAPAGQSTGLFEIGGKIFDLTALVRTGTDAGQRIESFGVPVAVTIDLSHLGDLTPEQISQLTGVRLEKDDQGNTVPVSLGGQYDPATRTFTFYTDTFSLYTVMRMERAAQKLVVELAVGSATASINGSPYALDAPPLVTEGRTLVPVRFVSEALGAKVTWDAAARRITVTDAGQVIALTLGSSQAVVGGETRAIDCPPATLPPGRTFVPLRFVGEALGAQVHYDTATKAITVTR